MRFWLVVLFVGGWSVSARAERCGPNNCEKGTTCCNSGCGICTKPGHGCVALACAWGEPLPCGNSALTIVDPYTHWAVSLGAVAVDRLDGVPGLTGGVANITYQRYLNRRFSLRASMQAGSFDDSSLRAAAALTATGSLRLFSWQRFRRAPVPGKGLTAYFNASVSGELGGLAIASYATPSTNNLGAALVPALVVGYSDKSLGGRVSAHFTHITSLGDEEMLHRFATGGEIALALGDFISLFSSNFPTVTLTAAYDYERAYSGTDEFERHRIAPGLYVTPEPAPQSGVVRHKRWVIGAEFNMYFSRHGAGATQFQPMLVVRYNPEADY